MRRPLLIVDGDSFAHRAYHALPKSIRRRGNKGAGAILGFANYLLRFHESEKPRAVLVAWDTLDAPTCRHDALPGYQAGREFDGELVDQLVALPEFVTACGFVCAKAAGYEADDFLAAAVAREERRGGTAIVATGDRDAYQLASDRTTVLQPVRAGELARIGPAEVRARYGVDPKQVPDFIALRGDSSDRIPGLAGMGDLIATCMSPQSRNRYVGEQLGKGRSVQDITDEMNMVAEGVKTSRVVMELAEEYGVEMPIASEVYAVCHEGATAEEAYRGLIRRQDGGIEHHTLRY